VFLCLSEWTRLAEAGYRKTYNAFYEMFLIDKNKGWRAQAGKDTSGGFAPSTPTRPYKTNFEPKPAVPA